MSKLKVLAAYFGIDPERVETYDTNYNLWYIQGPALLKKEDQRQIVGEIRLSGQRPRTAEEAAAERISLLLDEERKALLLAQEAEDALWERVVAANGLTRDALEHAAALASANSASIKRRIKILKQGGT